MCEYMYIYVYHMYACSDVWSVSCMWVFGKCGCGYMYILMFRHGCAFVSASQKMVFSNQHLCFESSV